MIMDRWIEDFIFRHTTVFFILLMIILFGGSFLILNERRIKNEKLLHECMDDGKKRYECVGILTGK